MKNLEANPPVRKVTGADGLVREEKLCSIPFNEKMVDADGNVVTVALATGYTIRGFGPQNPYGVQKRPEKLKKGFLPYSECPVAKGHVKLDGRSKACEGEDGRGKMKAGTCCKHIEEIIARRREQARKREDHVRERFATQSDRIIEVLRQQHNVQGRSEKPVTGAKQGLPG